LNFRFCHVKVFMLC